MKSMFDFKPGDKFITRDPMFVTNEKDPNEKRMVKVEVIKQYPEFVMVKNQKGIRWCITNAEMFQNWYQREFPGSHSAERGARFLASGKAA